MILPNNPVGPNGGTRSSSSSFVTNTQRDTNLEKNSSYSKSVSLGSGNARYEIQSYKEYVTIRNRSREEVNITGWKLRNAKDRRTFELGGNLQRYPADEARIPQASLFISPSGYSQMQNVILKPGEEAVITTGSIGARNPYPITSFKENICSGYLGASENYSFTPPLSRSCPRPIDEPGVESLPNECREFIRRMRTCRTPEFDTRNRDGEICSGCVDGQLLPSSCVAFIKEHYSYQGCIANHQSDPNFSKNTWRIFLNRGWEMWAKDYETIQLFDHSGKLVDYLSI